MLAWSGAVCSASPVNAADELAVSIVYVTQEEGTKLPPLSLLEPRELPDEGLAGATLGIADNQTTGGFLGHAYELTELIVPEDGDVAAAVAEALAAGKRFFVADLLAEDLLAIADLPAAEEALIFNGRAQDDALRTDECRANVFHTIPSRAMKADAPGPVPDLERWNLWFLIQGGGPPIRRSPRRCAASADEVQRQDRRGAHLRLRADLAGHRNRPRSGAAPDAGLHPGRARARRLPGRRRERRVRGIPAVPDLGPASDRRHPRSGADGLEPGPRAVGRHPDAEPIREARRAAGCASATTPHGSGCARWARR